MKRGGRFAFILHRAREPGKAWRSPAKPSRWCQPVLMHALWQMFGGLQVDVWHRSVAGRDSCGFMPGLPARAAAASVAEVAREAQQHLESWGHSLELQAFKGVLRGITDTCAEDGQIFVSIAAYADPELPATMQLPGNARSRFVVGSCFVRLRMALRSTMTTHCWRRMHDLKLRAQGGTTNCLCPTCPT